MSDRCKHCKTALIHEDELESGFCEDCIETMIERSRQRAEWNSYHDEPCPEVELTPMPKAKP